MQRFRIVAAALVPAVVAGFASATPYSIDDLQPMNWGSWSDSVCYAYGGVNNSGMVAGYSGSWGVWHDNAVKWDPGSTTAVWLGYPPEYEGGATWNYTEDINNGNAIVGFTFDPSWNPLSVYWDASQTFHVLPGFGKARGVNDAGVIVGQSGGQAYSWSPGDLNLTLLGLPGGASESYAEDLNQAGTIVGRATIGGAKLPYSYSVGTWNALPMLGGYTQGVASQIAADGTIYGNLWTTDDAKTRAVSWDAGGVHDLGTLGGDFATIMGANSLGDVVGMSTTGDGSSHGFLLKRGGAMEDLSLDFAPNGWLIDQVQGINDFGVLAGYGTNPAGTWGHAFRATPVPEPASVAALGSGLAFLLFRKRRR